MLPPGEGLTWAATLLWHQTPQKGRVVWGMDADSINLGHPPPSVHALAVDLLANPQMCHGVQARFHPQGHAPLCPESGHMLVHTVRALGNAATHSFIAPPAPWFCHACATTKKAPAWSAMSAHARLSQERLLHAHARIHWGPPLGVVHP